MVNKFAHAYLIEGALHHFGMDSVDDVPKFNLFNKEKNSEEIYVREVIHKFLQDHVLNPPPSFPGENTFSCRFCNKIYKLRSKLDAHEKKHQDLLASSPSGFQCNICGKVYKKEHFLIRHKASHVHDAKADTVDDARERDYVYNYTRRALILCCIWLNLDSAIQHGDGARVMLCYKFMYLYCKASNCPKYAYGLLETIAQGKYLLSERSAHDLIWNRFVNNKGEPDSNLPIDLDVEHLNRPLKTDVKTYRGELTDKTVQRISRSVEASDKVLKNFDKQTGVKRRSGTHKSADFKQDIMKIVDHLHNKQVYNTKPGREHMHVGKVSADPLTTLNMKSLHTWMKDSIDAFSRKSYYKC